MPKDRFYKKTGLRQGSSNRYLQGMKSPNKDAGSRAFAHHISRVTGPVRKIEAKEMMELHDQRVAEEMEKVLKELGLWDEE